MAKKIRISQCMIVKNEEQNIRHALSWGKGVVWEQIVVDTGSTDKTMEIAREMGAKVFHFEWCDDFSAAKNYALAKASGEWIAFLDADEYLSAEDARKLPGMLKKIEKYSQKETQTSILRTAWLHLDEDGNVFSAGQQDRIFRNMKTLRYQGRIHEYLQRIDGEQIYFATAENVSIMHTGYRQSVCSEKGRRNIPILKREVEENPENYDMWSYLGESYAANNQTMDALSCMEHVMEHCASDGSWREKIMEDRLDTAFSVWFSEAKYLPTDVIASYEEQAYRHYKQFLHIGILFPDVEYNMGRFLLQIGKQEEAVRFLKMSLDKLEQYEGGSSLTVSGSLDFVYNVLLAWYIEQSDAQKAVYYGTLSLRYDHYQEETLARLLMLFKDDPNTTAEQVFGFLAEMYRFENLKDKLFVLKTVMRIDYGELEKQVKGSLSEEEKRWLEVKSK